ncbi:MAG: ferredoxin [Calditrichaeota bacterium]|nr:MAG: ferredoxin [Calditrichota bacterium]
MEKKTSGDAPAPQREAEQLLNELDRLLPSNPTKVAPPAETYHLWQASQTPVDDDTTIRRLKKQHLAFYVGQHKGQGAEGLLPPALALMQHGQTVYAPFPLFLGETPDRLLTPEALIHTLINTAAPDDDQREMFTRYLAAIGRRLTKDFRHISEPLEAPELIRKLAGELLKQHGSRNGDNHPAIQALDAFSRSDLPGGTFFGFGPHTPRQLIPAAHAAQWRQQVRQALDRLEELTLAVNGLIENATSPELLSQEADPPFGDSIDFGKLDEIVRSVKRGASLSAQRLERLTIIAESLNRWHHILESDAHTRDFLSRFIATDTRANATHDAQDEIIRLIRDYHMAELEVKHQFDDAIHGDLFRHFSLHMLSDTEARLIPPTLLFIDAEQAAEHQEALITRLLSGEKVKIIVLAHTLFKDKQLLPLYAWARMAVSLNRVSVVQAPLSDLADVWPRVLEALAEDGAAFFSFYAPASRVNEFLYSGSAAGARFFPVYAFSGNRDKALCDRFYISDTIQPRNAWHTHTLTVRHDSEETTLSCSFTAADFLLLHPDFTNHFYRLEADSPRDHLIPLAEFVQQEDDTEARIPYILSADADGALHTLLVDDFIARHTLAIHKDWRLLQEWAGIDNSYVARALRETRARIEADAREEIEQLKQHYEARLREDRAQLTEEIISNLAAGLLSDEMIRVGSGMTAPVAPPPEEKTEADTPAEPDPPVTDEKEEEEETLALEEAYIDTPLCTSCNECRNINSQMFAYDANKQAYIADVHAGTFKELVMAAENCPVKIIHPGKPVNPDEPGLEELIKRAEKYNG